MSTPENTDKSSITGKPSIAGKASMATKPSIATGAGGEKRPNSLWRKIRNNFIYGIIVTVPIIAPVWLVLFVVRKTDEVIKPFIPAQWNPDTYLPFSIPGLGLLLSIVGLFILGTLAKNIFGRSLIGLGENILARVPIVSNLYTAGKQLVSTVAEQSTRENQEVCLIEYPRKDVWVVGFITSNVRGAAAKVLPDGYVNVFVPTSPNPTSGFLIMAQRSELRSVDLTPEDAAKLIISAGMVSEELPAANKG